MTEKNFNSPATKSLLSKSLLIVEDDKYILEALTQLLSEEGYDISSATNGEEALQFLRSATTLPGMILLDLMMPVKDGFAFRREQEQNAAWAGIPTVLMSADSNVAAKKVGVNLNLHIQKPLDLDQLINTVKEHCR